MIIYASRTTNVMNVCKKLDNIKCVNIKDIGSVNEPYFIFTYTDGIGKVPSHVEDFLQTNSGNLKGVIASGNTNFGSSFCMSADTISNQYDVPIIRKLDLRGTTKDIEAITTLYNKIIKSKG